MDNVRNRSAPSGKYAGWALIVLSLIGIFNGLSYEYIPQSTLIEIMVPYSIAFTLGVFRVFGYKWTRLPIIVLSLAGLSLNLFETIQGPNQKDIAEVILFFLIILLSVVDYVFDKNKIP